MEAGLELFGRGTPGPSDLLISVIEPSLWSIQTARRVADLGRELGIPMQAAVANKIRDEADVAWIRDAMREQGVELMGWVPYDPAVSDADRKMRSLLDVAPDSPAARAIAGVAESVDRTIKLTSGVAVSPGGDGAPLEDNGCPWVVDRYR